MTERIGKILLVAEALILLLPLTLVTALIVLLSYPAYPIPNVGLFQVAFDAAMLLQVAGVIAAWRLTVCYLHRGVADCVQRMSRGARSWESRQRSGFWA